MINVVIRQMSKPRNSVGISLSPPPKKKKTERNGKTRTGRDRGQTKTRCALRLSNGYGNQTLNYETVFLIPAVKVIARPRRGTPETVKTRRGRPLSGGLSAESVGVGEHGRVCWRDMARYKNDDRVVGCFVFLGGIKNARE